MKPVNTSTEPKIKILILSSSPVFGKSPSWVFLSVFESSAALVVEAGCSVLVFSEVLSLSLESVVASSASSSFSWGLPSSVSSYFLVNFHF
jgi:hypothetical protein